MPGRWWPSLLVALTALARATEADLPQYEVTFRDIPVVGFVCDGPPTAIVFHPSNGAPGQTFPVISFLHGSGSGGNDTRFNYFYGPLMGNVSSHGFVVIAPLSAVTECPDFPKDQLTALSADFAAHGVPADPTRAGVMGQSSGGPHAIQSAGRAGPNVRAAFALHPAGARLKDAREVRVPIVLATGSKDFEASALAVGLVYGAIPVRDKSFGVLKGAGHLEAAGGRAGRWAVWIAHFFACHLAEDTEACEFFYGQFCAGDVDTFTFCRVPKHPQNDEHDR
jgi:pimeloyl-ACP methyl ester carboxylesterase